MVKRLLFQTLAHLVLAIIFAVCAVLSSIFQPKFLVPCAIASLLMIVLICERHFRLKLESKKLNEVNIILNKENSE